MKSIAKSLAIALFGGAMASVPVVAQTVTIDYDHSVNFLKFKIPYTWEKGSRHRPQRRRPDHHRRQSRYGRQIYE